MKGLLVVCYMPLDLYEANPKHLNLFLVAYMNKIN